MTTTTWRDIADHLTSRQVDELERWEALGDEPAALLLFAASMRWATKPVCSSASNSTSVAFACASASENSLTVPRSGGSNCRLVTCGLAMTRSTSCARHCSIPEAEVSGAERVVGITAPGASCR